jgi:pimeloyl-ACP methyl ester carboxylesterase
MDVNLMAKRRRLVSSFGCMRGLLLLIATCSVFTAPPASCQAPFDQDVSGEPSLYVEEVGVSDAVVIVLHGGPGISHDYLRPEWDRLVDQGYRVVYYDQRGCGRSGDGAPYTWRADVADLRRVIEGASPHGPVVLAGSSWGSWLALLYAMEYQNDVKALVLSGTPPWPMTLSPYAENLVRRIRQSQGHEVMVRARPRADSINAGLVSIQRIRPDSASARTHMPAEDPVLASRFVRAPQLVCTDAHAARVAFWNDIAPADSLANISAPTLYIWGSEDRMLNRRARQMSKLLLSARVHIMEGLGHDPWLEEPALFFDVVKGFLLSVEEP